MFLRSLHEEGLLSYNGRSWKWDLKQIANCGMAGSIVDLLVDKLNLLPPPCQEVSFPVTGAKLVGSFCSFHDRVHIFVRYALQFASKYSV